jgi:hypothetical protein
MSIQSSLSYCETRERRNKMAEMFLGTSDRNDPENVKGRMIEITLF